MAAIACWLLALAPAFAGANDEIAWERSEAREPCRHYQPLRQAFFGDVHVHTAFSFDAMGQGTLNGPREAYRYARGEPVGIQPVGAQGRPARSVRLRRPLDFAAVTDHSDLLGETQMCQSAGAPGYGSLICTVSRRWPKLGYILVNGHVYSSEAPTRFGFCGPEGRRCLEAAASPWRLTREAAEEFYDRTSACTLTTFVGYEWTGMPAGSNIHRNVIFRNEVAQDLPTTYLETPTAEGLWRALLDECIERDARCDAIAIPHNSNVSNGLLFTVTRSDGSPITAEDARVRARLERLVEVTQHKGDSECRAGAEDELCSYETLPWPRMMDQPLRWRWGALPPLLYAREVLTEGLVQQLRLGVNPFRFGLIGSTDTHFGTPGMVDEDQFIGHAAGTVSARFGVPDFPDTPWFNPGGLAVLWAEENSRDALFAAMRRREAYGTSGPRIRVRFFGGWSYDDDLCSRQDFAARGYAGGVPMGGELPPPPGPHAAPRFAVWALRDPGGAGAPSTPLQRVQIVKGWVEGGEGRERIHEVAGSPDGDADVDLRSCRPRGAGHDGLCAVWSDPDFDPAQPAFYYARVVENPSCRWNTYVCNRRRVDCGAPDGVPAGLEACCDPAVPRTIQERAWTSPIWYTPHEAGFEGAAQGESG